jgi:signal transduction histidine kinase
MTLVAGVAALIAIFGPTDHSTLITVICALIGLVPWVLEASGLRLGPVPFLTMTMLPASAIVLLDVNPGGLFLVYIALVEMLHRRYPRSIVATGFVAAVAMTIGYGIAVPHQFEGTIYFLGGIGISCFSGLLLRRQETLMSDLREATERERIHAAVEERARIAREVHDVIAHSLTVTILHVTGARRALANDPHRAAVALERAEEVGRESLDSIRQVVGLLRSSNDPAVSERFNDDGPLPLLSNIPMLITQFREAGLDIDDSLDLDDVTTGAMTSLTAFRLVQEALTNALRHAPGSPVSLAAHCDHKRTSIKIKVENLIHPHGSNRRQSTQQGLGLTGMVERVRACSGSIEYGPTESNTWLISADLPLDIFAESL